MGVEKLRAEARRWLRQARADLKAAAAIVEAAEAALGLVLPPHAPD
jgi:hypothetical protein